MKKEAPPFGPTAIVPVPPSTVSVPPFSTLTWPLKEPPPTASYSGQVSVLNGGTLTVEGGTGTIAVRPNGGASFFIVGGGAPGTLPGTVEAASILVGSGSILSFDHVANNYIFELPISGSGEILVGRGTTV